MSSMMKLAFEILGMWVALSVLTVVAWNGVKAWVSQT